MEGSSLIIASLIFLQRILLCFWRDSRILFIASSEISEGRVKERNSVPLLMVGGGLIVLKMQGKRQETDSAAHLGFGHEYEFHKAGSGRSFRSR